MDRTTIPVDKSTRRELAIIKAERGHRSYDDLLRSMIDERAGENR